MSPDQATKYGALRDLLASYGKVAVAFSGGVDSTFLLAVAHDVLGDNVFAITSRSCLMPAEDCQQAVDFCQQRGIVQKVVDADPLALPAFETNPPDRCYWCKKDLFSCFLALAQGEGATLVEGRNQDDDDDYRPGTQAVLELGVASPLHIVGLTKQDIRDLSHRLGLPTWDKPSAACLASRIPYGTPITADALRRVDAAERFLHDAGLRQVRVRAHGNLARIEVAPAEMDALYQAAKNPAFRQFFHEVGFAFVTLDLDGYRMGSLNVDV